MNIVLFIGLVAVGLSRAQYDFGYEGGFNEGPPSCKNTQFWNGEACVAHLSYGKVCALAAYKGHVCGSTLRCKKRCVCSPGYFWNGKICHKFLGNGGKCTGYIGYKGRVCGGNLRCLKGKCGCKSPLIYQGGKCIPRPKLPTPSYEIGGFGGGGGHHAGYGAAPRYSSFGYAAAKVLAGGCPYGWSPYHGSCYYFSRDKLSWWQAEMKCASQGGYLVIVDAAHENSFIRRYLAEYRVTGGAWFGLNDCLFPNKHRWIWGFSKKRCHKFDWYGQEPIYHAKGDWNCGAFWETYQYHWHVDSCAQRNYYVCEMKLGKPCRCQY
ncbi:neurocan core protein-like [Saccostrea echinata]|uniref:neurocan core protein-like n=1 Tax=Saccostrea echinata TaxID=191078 RepID=UPI002A809F67|nr:neurocan core protein-like [Saccostrea echinata]